MRPGEIARGSRDNRRSSRTCPDRVRSLTALWDDYVKANDVILPSRSPYEGLEEKMPERFPVEPGYPPLIYKRQFVPPAELSAEPER